ncbi:hypothetical protein SAMN04488245_110207 [Alloyangia pacifica]|uniref:Uncharacterized protein n=1 Tax=Alloyangia pacifica TaxID=311180 RepID=A0A1I6V8K0_9RHOB|nr:hypothetical protein SAMN04488245_110207 [Alloyangia pacifica]SFT09914.1 hypothetical protein SAMN04488050_11058 [Alloyangia pacifica]
MQGSVRDARSHRRRAATPPPDPAECCGRPARRDRPGPEIQMRKGPVEKKWLRQRKTPGKYRALIWLRLLRSNIRAILFASRADGARRAVVIVVRSSHDERDRCQTSGDAQGCAARGHGCRNNRVGVIFLDNRSRRAGNCGRRTDHGNDGCGSNEFFEFHIRTYQNERLSLPHTVKPIFGPEIIVKTRCIGGLLQLVQPDFGHPPYPR